MSQQPKTPIPQNLKKYNRESGNKTLIFIGTIIALIAFFTILSLILMLKKPQILTSSVEKQTPAPSNNGDNLNN